MQDEDQAHELPDDDDAPQDQALIAGSGVDPLHALLDLDLSQDDSTVTYKVPIRPSGAVLFTFKVVADIDDLRESCTRWVRKPGARKERVQEVDGDLFLRKLIVEATLTPNLADPMLQSKFSARKPEDVVTKLLKPGTISKLGDVIMDHAGYDDMELVLEGKG